MKFRLIAFLLLIISVSCNESDTFPEKILNRISLSELKLETDFTNVKEASRADNEVIRSVLEYASTFEKKDVNFDLTALKRQWESALNQNVYSDWGDGEFVAWGEITGLLLELTGEEKYAEMLEFISNYDSDVVQKSLAPFILSKRMDFIYVNLFKPVEIIFQHSLGGNVNFKIDTVYPKSGSVKFHFGMTERRYIELYIRIPSWAEGATVTVKQVKYFAAPGTYCKIAKKWREGDLVEIEFPIDKKPQ